jgi:hypothetical protein
MPRKGLRVGPVVRVAFAWASLTMATATAGEPAPRVFPTPQEVPIHRVGSLDQLVRMSRCELDQLYRNSRPGPLPEGKVRGRVILFPGTALARPTSRFSRLLWQGKVIDGANGRASNKFFGVKFIKGNLGCGPSWMDGRPATILDYSETSYLYANYRDEIRQVGPGLFLGAMYSRTSPEPTFMMYFALQAATTRGGS